jgi:hypothetical protein
VQGSKADATFAKARGRNKSGKLSASLVSG